MSQDEVELRAVSERVKRTLTPVTPTPEFRARLRSGLQSAAQHRATPHLVIEKHDAPPWGWIVSALAVGSLAGLIALILRLRRSQRATA